MRTNWMFSCFFRYLKRHHVHVVCHKGDRNVSCLVGEGTCVENVVQRELVKRKSHNSSEMETRFIQFTNSCSCEVIVNSVFENLV